MFKEIFRSDDMNENVIHYEVCHTRLIRAVSLIRRCQDVSKSQFTSLTDSWRSSQRSCSQRHPTVYDEPPIASTSSSPSPALTTTRSNPSTTRTSFHTAAIYGSLKAPLLGNDLGIDLDLGSLSISGDSAFSKVKFSDDDLVAITVAAVADHEDESINRVQEVNAGDSGISTEREAELDDGSVIIDGQKIYPIRPPPAPISVRRTRRRRRFRGPSFHFENDEPLPLYEPPQDLEAIREGASTPTQRTCGADALLYLDADELPQYQQ